MTSVSWVQIRESLQTFDRTTIIQAVQQLLDEELSSVKFDRSHRELPHTGLENIPLAQKVDLLLTQTAGLWYGAGGLRVGDEILSFWCWRHSFPASLEAPTRSQQIQQGAIAILGQLEQLRNFLLKLTELFDSMPLSTDLNLQEAQMQAATMVIVKFIVLETQCHESWYDYVSIAITWFLESKKVVISETLQSSILITVECCFNSYTVPSMPTRKSFSETIALELFKQEFDRQYLP
jgi:hypothetical protein